MDTAALPDPVELPIACTLGTDDGAARMRRWRALATAAHPTAVRNGQTLAVRFEPGAGVYEELTALAAAEQDCCSFADWTVVEADGHPVLRVLAKPPSPNGIDAIAAMFEGARATR